MKRPEPEVARMDRKMSELAAYRYSFKKGVVLEEDAFCFGSDPEMVKVEACCEAADGAGFTTEQAMCCEGGELGCPVCPFRYST